MRATITAVLLATAGVLLLLAAYPTSADPYRAEAQGGTVATAATPFVVATVTLGSQAKSVAVDPGNWHQAYVTLYNAADTSNVVAVDGATGTILGITGTQRMHPNGIAVNTANHRLYVSNREDSSVTSFDVGNGDRQQIAVGSSPWGVAVHPALNRIYVANFASDSVSIINGNTGAVWKTVGSIPRASFVAVDAVRHLVYVTSNSMGLYVLDADGNIQAGPLNTSDGSMGVAVDPASGTAYIANHAAGNPRLYVYVPGEGVLPSPIALPAPPVNVAVNPTTNRIFVTMVGADGLSLAVVDGQTRTLLTTIALGAENTDQGQGLAVDPVLSRVYVTRYQASALVIVSDPAPATPTPTASPTRTSTATLPPSPTATPAPPTPTATLTKLPTVTQTSVPATVTATATQSAVPTGTVSVIMTITVGIHPKGLAVDTTRHRLYITMIEENNVRVYDGSTAACIGALATGGSEPNGVAVNEQTGMVFTTNRGSNNISAIDPDFATYATIPSGYSPWGIAVDAWHNRVYAANFGSDTGDDTVKVLDATTLAPIITTPIGRRPALVAVNPALGRAYVTTYASDAGTYVLDSSGTVVDILLTGSGSFGVAANASSGRVYVTNRITNRLYIITGSSKAYVDLGAPGYGVAVNPTTGHVFVIAIAGGQATLQMRAGDSGNLLASLPLGAEDGDSGGQGIAVDPVLNRVYVLSYATGVLTVIADGAPPAPAETPTASATATATAAPPTPTSTPGGGMVKRAYFPVIVAQAEPTPSATATSTLAPGNTRTATVTPWPSATRTPSSTSIPTFTRTPSITPTPTATTTPWVIDWQIPDMLHVSLIPASVPSGQAYWRLTRAIFQDVDQSGGNHNVYYRLEDETGQDLLGLYVCLGWPDGQDCSHQTESHAFYPAGYGADYPIYEDYNPDYGAGPYSAWAGGLASDRVTGLGLPLKQHVNFLLTFQLAVAP